jgi:hypothetical protein
VSAVLATIVDTTALWQTIAYALVAAVGVTLIFSLAIRGAARFGDHSRDGRTLAAAMSGGLAVVGLLATAAAIVAAVIVMTTK